MRTTFIFTIALLLLAASVAGQYTCYSEEQLAKQTSDCKAVGLESTRYQDERGCSQVRCVETEVTCPPKDQLDKDAETCRMHEQRAQYDIDQNECEYVTCVNPRCPTEQDYQNALAKCTEYGKTAETITDEEGCKYARCSSQVCDDSKVSASTQFCLKQGRVPQVTTGTDGCKTVVCRQPAGTLCRKSVTGNCTIFTCADGASFDSCGTAPCVTPTTPSPPSAVAAPAEGFFHRIGRIFGFVK